MLRVLFVEDTPGCQQVISIALRGAGHQVTIAPDANAALDHLGDERPDLILLDMVMPGPSGLELLGRIRRDERWRTIPVIVFTATTDGVFRRKAEALGVQAYFIKSQVSVKDLRAAVAKHATGSSDVVVSGGVVSICGR